MSAMAKGADGKAKKIKRLPAGKAGRRAALKSKAEAESAEIARLTAELDAADADADTSGMTRFTDFPLSRRTLDGLGAAGFVEPTAIQQRALLRALKGQDVLGAAKTGSGKTLAFLVPVLERLWRVRWSKMDGVGAVVISPTRELALQTFQCLASVGGKHDMSAGLIIGGTTFEREQANIPFTNILICTPGRLLQHLDETPNFDCMNVQVLVLDEADRILDLGFAKAMDAIVRAMPPLRQTLLFSATQTSSVSELARLSLRNPARLSTTPASESATPDQLMQAYVVCPLDRKLDVLFSFIRTHLDSKTLVFVSSCKQVRYIYEMFRRFRPGVPLMALYGKQKQMKRVAIFTDFTRKKSAVLFATDIAARGLDFPSVDWVFQLDCPESVETYIHRVGRTARFNKGGKALMTLLPSEADAMVGKLVERKIELHRTEVAEDQMKPVTPLLRSLCASDTELKYLAQKCFISYVRSVHLQHDKDVFRLEELPADDFAVSLGLPSTPKIKLTKKMAKKRHKKSPADVVLALGGGGGESGVGGGGVEGGGAAVPADEAPAKAAPAKKKKTKFEALRTRQNQDVLSSHRLAVRDDEDDGDDDGEDGLLVKSSVQRHEEIDAVAPSDDPEAQAALSKKRKKKIRTRADLVKAMAGGRGNHLTFGDDGAVRDERERLVGWEVGPGAAGPDGGAVALPDDVARHDLGEAQEDLRQADVVDREVEKERLRERRRRRKMRLKELSGDFASDGAIGGAVLLGSAGHDGGGVSDDEDNGGSGGGGESRRAKRRRRDTGDGDGDGDGDDDSESRRRRDPPVDDEDLALWLLENSQ